MSYFVARKFFRFAKGTATNKNLCQQPVVKACGSQMQHVVVVFNKLLELGVERAFQIQEVAIFFQTIEINSLGMSGANIFPVLSRLLEQLSKLFFLEKFDLRNLSF